MVETILADLGILIIGITAFAIAGRVLNQPNILSYILAGIVLGSSVLGLIESHEFIQTLSDLGIAFLLFLVGLRIKFDDFESLGKASILTAGIQMIALSVTSFLLATYFQFSPIESVFIACAAIFSSTAVVIKFLEDSDDLDKLFGKINIGILLIQDIVVVLVLTAISGLSRSSGFSSSLTIFSAGVGILAFTVIASRLFLPTLFKEYARSEESFFIASLGWCMLLISISEAFSLSIEIGSFLAGLSLAQLPYNEELVERVRPLTDVFIALFFASIGLNTSIGALSGKMAFFVGFIMLLMALKFSTSYLSLKRLGYTDETSFMVGISLSQISEFSLLVIALGHRLGHVSDSTLSVVSLAGITTIGISSYLIRHRTWLFNRLRPRFGLTRSSEHHGSEEALSDHIVLTGCHLLGHELLQTLDEREDILIVDHDPDVIANLQEQGYNATYGDIADLKPRENLNLHEAKLVISTVPDLDKTKLLVNDAKKHDVPIVVRAETLDESLEMYRHGADYVIFPDMLSAQETSVFIQNMIEHPGKADAIRLTNKKRIEEEKKEKGIWYEVFYQ